ncbi:hypothetical protein GE09DRAFT_1254762 [Coniochaeta sp. 2T2.1]|nr:hypothetical protein GE09DRAFT_1254762 [Coniochaeta sp. 2T2.1]
MVLATGPGAGSEDKTPAPEDSSPKPPDTQTSVSDDDPDHPLNLSSELEPAVEETETEVAHVEEAEVEEVEAEEAQETSEQRTKPSSFEYFRMKRLEREAAAAGGRQSGPSRPPPPPPPPASSRTPSSLGTGLRRFPRTLSNVGSSQSQASLSPQPQSSTVSLLGAGLGTPAITLTDVDPTPQGSSSSSTHQLPSDKQEEGSEEEEQHGALADLTDENPHHVKDPVEQQNNCRAFRWLHFVADVDDPVFVVHVHDLLTASIAAEHAHVQALCVDLTTLGALRFLKKRRMATTEQKFLREQVVALIRQISIIAHRNGKLLTVDLGVYDAGLLRAVMPYLLDLGAVGVDLRDNDWVRGDESWSVANRIWTIRQETEDRELDAFVVNVVMAWPGSVDQAIENANLYVECGADVVTILRRVPDKKYSEADFRRMTEEIQCHVGFVMQMPFMGETALTARDLVRTGAARVTYGNQWPYFIRSNFDRAVELQFPKEK